MQHIVAITNSSVAKYIVEADTSEEAIEIFNSYGAPSCTDESPGPVKFFDSDEQEGEAYVEESVEDGTYS